MTSNARRLGFLGAVFAGVGVGLGAFAAHGLRGSLTSVELATFETGVRYQMYHALALLITSWAANHTKPKLSQLVGILFTVGMVLFSGSLYLLALTEIRWIGAITPVGGVSLLIGWVVLALSLWPSRTHPSR